MAYLSVDIDIDITIDINIVFVIVIVIVIFFKKLHLIKTANTQLGIYNKYCSECPHPRSPMLKISLEFQVNGKSETTKE